MTKPHNAQCPARRVVRAAAVAMAAFMFALSVAPQVSHAQNSLGTKDKANALVEEARTSLERMLGGQDNDAFKRYLNNARAVLIVPELIKGGLIVGAEGGSGVLLVRGADGTWSAPAFYTLAAGSLGLQFGVQISEVVFTVMTDSAVEALLNSEFKLGADASVAMGPLGAGIEASSTTNVGADIYAFSRAVGLFGGGALEGAKILNRQDYNDGYYGAVAPPRDVVIERKFFNPQADKLRQALPKGGT
jgi:lipid-binding SYLF domain-containing protein